MKIVPLGANVVVKRLPAEEITAGGIVLPTPPGRNLGRDACCRSAMAGCWPTAAGPAIRSAKATGCCSAATPAPKWIVNGEEFLIMSEDEILAVVP